MVDILNIQLNLYTNEQLSRYTNRQLELLDFLGYICDRTNDDIERWRELRDKGWDGMTETERKEWLGEIMPTPSAVKGMYTYKDLNRIESTIEYLAIYFREIGYDVPEMTLKLDWKRDDEITRSEMDRYFSNINTIRNVLRVFPDTPEVPHTDEVFTHLKANDIERIIEDVFSITNNLTDSWCYTNEVVSGEV